MPAEALEDGDAIANHDAQWCYCKPQCLSFSKPEILLQTTMPEVSEAMPEALEGGDNLLNNHVSK
jgi:hypothetical protein